MTKLLKFHLEAATASEKVRFSTKFHFDKQPVPVRIAAIVSERVQIALEAVRKRPQIQMRSAIEQTIVACEQAQIGPRNRAVLLGLALATLDRAQREADLCGARHVGNVEILEIERLQCCNLLLLHDFLIRPPPISDSTAGVSLFRAHQSVQVRERCLL